ncbi:hypothetical protein [Xanthovirga aplysinae]|uniref:hypothetical protein n=1 Tax=Xanthovirga aplysinae TaxID=2529853 RepID=UPI0012BC5489|nr:hypothetical protein [Xanthovirga aplysinae]MTI30586.1 hypothetical protein [Xanthovirga aplysinae]
MALRKRKPRNGKKKREESAESQLRDLKIQIKKLQEKKRKKELGQGVFTKRDQSLLDELTRKLEDLEPQPQENQDDLNGPIRNLEEDLQQQRIERQRTQDDDAQEVIEVEADDEIDQQQDNLVQEEIVQIADDESQADDSEVTEVTWGSLLEDNARTDHTQQFGAEIEFNNAVLRYNAHPQFKDFAVQYGHRGIWKHADGMPFEIHLDQIDKKAKLEIVINPPVSPAEFPNMLKYIKENFMNKKGSEVLEAFTWKTETFDPQTIDDGLLELLSTHDWGTMTGIGTQVTTTHTANEMKSVITKTREKFQQIRDDSRASGDKFVSMNRLHQSRNQRELTDANIVNAFMGKMKRVEEQDEFPNKGKFAMIKHAQEQFNVSTRVADIDAGTKADRIKKDTAGLKKLHTQANKLAPIFKRPNGDIAYVVEYRSAAQLTKDTDSYLSGIESMTQEKYIEKLKGYYTQEDDDQ